MSNDTRSDYYSSVHSAAADAAESIRDHNQEASVALHAASDGSYWVIYYHAAALTLQYSDNEDAIFDECGDQTWDSHGSAVTTMAAWAYAADVREAFSRKFREDGTNLDSLSADDIEHLTETYTDATEDQTTDEYEGEVVMTSLGYVDLGADGSVTMNGSTIYTVEVA